MSLITIEITINPVQAASLSNALEVGGQETGCDLAQRLGDLIDDCRRKVTAVPNCAGTTVRQWFAPKTKGA